VYSDKDNPIEGLTLSELEATYGIQKAGASCRNSGVGYEPPRSADFSLADSFPITLEPQEQALRLLGGPSRP
jgi:hypothetical protein